MNEQCCQCIEDIVQLYYHDTVVLLDCVLTDDPKDPKYSANHVYHRVEKIVQFYRCYFHEQIADVDEFLSMIEYTREDISLLHEKILDEKKRHSP